MKTRIQNISKEHKIMYLVIGLFVLNAFGMIPIGVIGAYTAEPMKVTVRETLEDGTMIERTVGEIYYHEGLSEGIQNNIYEFFKYSLPVTMTGYFLVTLPEFYDYVGIAVWVLSLVSVPLVIKYTANFPIWRRFLYTYFIAVQIAGMWAIGHVNFECISFIDYPVRPGPSCGI